MLSIRTITVLRMFTPFGWAMKRYYELKCPTGPVELRENYGFTRRELVRIAEILNGNLVPLCGAWESIHGL